VVLRSLKGSGHWCGTGLHSWDINSSWFFHDNPHHAMWMCQRIYHPPTDLSIDLTCGYEYSHSSYDGNRTCVCYQAHAAQMSGHNHTVTGYGEA
jgi:hypothetical protein